jgi:hypothetical protein
MITLNIKARGVHTASQEVVNRGIRVMARPAIQVNDYTVRIDACDDSLTEIAKWFAEEHQLIKGIGYPDGTLLLYSFHSEAVA